MSLQLSTGLVNRMMGFQARPKAIAIGTNLSYVDGGVGADSITDAGNLLVSDGFEPGRLIYTYGSTTAANNLSAVVLLSVAAGSMTFATGTVNTPEAFTSGTVVVCCDGGSVRDTFCHGVLRIFSGTVPAAADDAITGTLLAQLTISSGVFVAGAFTNGLTFGDAAAGVIGMAAGEVWSGLAVAAGSATHYRFVGNPADSNASSTTLCRIQGTVNTSGADAIMPNTTISLGQTVTATSWTYTYNPT